MIQPTMPALPELLDRYLRKQTDSHNLGLGVSYPTSEVEPFEAVPVQPVDAALAWREGHRALDWYQPAKVFSVRKAPSEWPALVASLEPMAAVPLCAGNYPQLARDFHVLLGATDLGALLPNSHPTVPAAQVMPNAKSATILDRMMILGMYRLARSFESTQAMLDRLRADDTNSEWQSALANEEAALAWHSGRTQQAAELWAKQTDSLPVLFNRGMSGLFLGRASQARNYLQQAVALLPEEDAWHHLGRLYLTLAEMREPV